MALVIGSKDRAQARNLQRSAANGQIRRLYPGIYTDDLVQPLESIVRRELFALCSLITPGSIISHRSALEGGRPTAAGNLFLTGPSRRGFEWPGVRLRMVRGLGPLDSDIRILTFTGDAFISSQARALLENLTFSRGDAAERRTLGVEGVEDWLARFISRDVSGATNKIRAAARSIAGSLGLESELNSWTRSSALCSVHKKLASLRRPRLLELRANRTTMRGSLSSKHWPLSFKRIRFKDCSATPVLILTCRHSSRLTFQTISKAQSSI